MEKPNILYIFCDQFRRQAIGYMKEDPVVTPNLDRFAGEAVVFKEAVSTYPVCSPYRGILFTGMYPHETTSLPTAPPKVRRKAAIFTMIRYACRIFWQRADMRWVISENGIWMPRSPNRILIQRASAEMD